MRYHVYKSIWTPPNDEQLHAAMQPTKRISKYAVTVTAVGLFQKIL